MEPVNANNDISSISDGENDIEMTISLQNNVVNRIDNNMIQPLGSIRSINRLKKQKLKKKPSKNKQTSNIDLLNSNYSGFNE